MKKILFIAVTVLIFMASTVSAYASQVDFEFNDSDCGIAITGGNDITVKDGKLIAGCSDGAVVFSSGTISVENNGYIVFSVRSEKDITGATVEAVVNKYTFTALSLKGTGANVFAINLNDISSTVTSFSIKVSAFSGDSADNKIYLDYIRFPSNITVDYDTEKHCTVFSALSEKINVVTSEEEYVAFATSYGAKDKFAGAKIFESGEAVSARVSESASKSKVIFFKSKQTLVPLGEELNVSMVCEFSEWV